MEIYVMRHGTTVWNEKGITQGRTNNRLSKNGISLTKQVSKQYKNTKFDLIVCSPLMRTVQTANLMNYYHNVKILKDVLLIEIDQGIFTGRHKDSLSKQEFELKNQRSKKCGMESYQQIFDRTKQFVKDLKDKYGDKTVLIVTHNCNATMIEDILLKKPVNFADKTFLRNFANDEVKKFEI